MHVGFALSDWKLLEHGDQAKISEVILEREEETRRFLERRAAGPSNFGAYAAVFRSFTYSFRTPPGLLPWLRERCPGICAGLDRQADRVRELWQEGAPMEEYEAAVRLLEEKHRAARGFYEAHQKGNENEQG
jgi:hypothetical protein